MQLSTASRSVKIESPESNKLRNVLPEPEEPRSPC